VLAAFAVQVPAFSVMLGCSKKGERDHERVLIFGLDDRVSGAPKGVKFDLQQARSLLEDAIDASERMEVVEEKELGSYQAELTITLASERESQRSEEDGIYRAVHVDLVLTRWLNDHDRDTLSSQGKAFMVQDPDRLSRQKGFDRVLEQAIQQAVEIADLQFGCRRMTTEELAGLLSSERTEDRLYVLRTLRERADRDLIPRIIELLSDPDPDVAMEAVGVLVAQKDPRAVPPLIRMTEGRDTVFLLQIITALAEIKGPVARGYLFTLAAGHLSEAIRTRAREALGQVLRAEQSERSEPQKKAIALPRTERNGSNPKSQGGP
jgi:hypothetical protein